MTNNADGKYTESNKENILLKDFTNEKDYPLARLKVESFDYSGKFNDKPYNGSKVRITYSKLRFEDGQAVISYKDGKKESYSITLRPNEFEELLNISL